MMCNMDLRINDTNGSTAKDMTCDEYDEDQEEEIKQLHDDNKRL
jgi:hypothetical protein